MRPGVGHQDTAARGPSVPSRRVRSWVTGAVVAALLMPVALDRDGLPLSTYPMYARTRGETSSIVTAVGVTAAGDRVRLTPTVIGASDDPLIVVGQLRADLAAGRADERCVAVADRLSHGGADGDGVPVAVEIVTERHDTVARVRDEASLLAREVHATCEVAQP